jgi:EAL domain-containing protein (putative c-di-GMP-specific phosphodiesterase class I)
MTNQAEENPSLDSTENRGVESDRQFPSGFSKPSFRSETQKTTSPMRQLLREKQFTMVFQPIVDLNTWQIFAQEALVRSKNPVFVSPPELFSAAINEGCCGELGRAIRDMTLDLCPMFPLFINIHPLELNEHWIVQPNDPIFLHTEDIFLEITESAPLTHPQLCQTILQEISGKGVHLVVDDLGAGYSNLKYIADLNPKVVKLDRELISGLRTTSRLFKLVCSLVDMCSSLGAEVVAEGIETPQELHAVMLAGVTYGQGYLLARPAFPPPMTIQVP